MSQRQYVNDEKVGKVVLASTENTISPEDEHDLAVVAERKSEKPITLNELKRRLKKS